MINQFIYRPASLDVQLQNKNPAVAKKGQPHAGVGRSANDFRVV